MLGTMRFYFNVFMRVKLTMAQQIHAALYNPVVLISKTNNQSYGGQDPWLPKTSQ